jgi:DNA-binding GntR family transcriptional regulator
VRPVRTHTSGSDQLTGAADWQRLSPRTLVEQAVEAIVAGAARGVILPGDRINEAEVARGLGISRVPVREGLRLLESQGVVTSTPYRGTRLMEVTPERIEQVVDVRMALEVRAALAAVRLGRNHDVSTAGLETALAELSLMAARQDAYGFAMADIEFHRQLCRLGGNAVLSMLWESLARQLTVIVGLSTLGKSMPQILAEHEVLLAEFRRGEHTGLKRALEDHIGWQHRAIDYQRLIAERRDQRSKLGITGRSARTARQADPVR